MEKLPRLFMRKNVKEWNSTAIDCYNLGCECSRCFIYHTYFKNAPIKCKMKYYVKMLYDKLGAPEPQTDFPEENAS